MIESKTYFQRFLDQNGNFIPYQFECSELMLSIPFLKIKNKTSSVSIKEIKNIQNQFDRCCENFRKINPEGIHDTSFESFLKMEHPELISDICLFNRTKDFAEDFFKNHTVLVHVNHDAGFGNHLFIFGLDGDWEKGHALDVKNHFDWSIRIPKPQEDNCFYYKIVKIYSDNRKEWQPGENQIILPDCQEIFHRIKGDFSEEN